AGVRGVKLDWKEWPHALVRYVAAPASVAQLSKPAAKTKSGSMIEKSIPDEVAERIVRTGVAWLRSHVFESGQSTWSYIWACVSAETTILNVPARSAAVAKLPSASVPKLNV